MALIKTAFFHDEAYHRISSFEYHRDKQRLRIRLDVYLSKIKEKLLGTTEYQVDNKSFIPGSRLEAEKSVNMAAIRKIAEDKIKKVEDETKKEDKELTQAAKDMIHLEEKEFAITEKMKDIGREKWRLFVEDLESKNRKTLSLLYNVLKEVEKELKGAIDS